jgi:Ca2+-binding RTX toxin-like protein
MATYNGDTSQASTAGSTLNGTAGNDNLYGTSGNDIFNGGTGNDLLAGGLGDDTYLIAKNAGADTIVDEGGTDVVKFTNMLASDISHVSSANYGKDLLLSYGSSQLTIQNYFNFANNRIEQFQFSDGTVWGLADIEAHLKLTGTSADDTLYGTIGSNDTLNGLAGNDTLWGFFGNDTLNGGTGNDLLVGGLGDDTYLIAKNDGVDAINDDGGTDVVKFTDLLATDISQVRPGGFYGTDLLLSYGTSQLTIQGYFAPVTRIEQLQFSDGTVWGLADIKARISSVGTSGDDTLYGYYDSNDTLNGLAGNDTLYGYSSNDSLNGGSGDDTLDGGYGFDVAQYYTATAGVTVDLNLTTAQDTVGAGIDTLNSIEAINGSAFNDTLTGNGYDNSLFGGVGNDILTGGDGNDSLVGGVGNDVLDGGNGFDIAHYYTATAGVTVNLNLTAAQNTLGAGFDTLTNIEAVNGSAFNDTLTGNAANNSLLGGKGNDVLDGGLGKDVLTGGLGQDSFVFDTALGLGNVDIISDFTVADDTVQLAHNVFTALSLGGLAADQFKIVGTGGVVDGNDHVLYNSASGVLSYDSDGSGAGAAVLVAILGKSLAMTAADFMVV